MRLYMHNGQPVEGSGATREYALFIEQLDDFDGPKRTYRRRDCPICGARLSSYNLTKTGLCWPCQKRADEPLPAEVWIEVFEHVAAALCAPWEVDNHD